MTHPLRTHLTNVAAALQSDAMQARVMGAWDKPNSRPTAQIGPVATTSQLRGLRDAIGGELPSSLREVLEEVSADIEMGWVLRGHFEKADWGGQEVVTDVTPPDALLEWSRGLKADGTPPEGAKRQPKFISGRLRFSLDGITRAIAGVPGWQTLYADNTAYDADLRAHFDLIRDFMGAGVPVMTAGNGDWLAIDQRDEGQCMLHVSHEGEEAGIEIDLTLPNFLAHQSFLGPVMPDFSEVFSFSDEVTEVIAGDPRVSEAPFSAMSAKGQIWRDWFWEGSGLEDPDPALLTRC